MHNRLLVIRNHYHRIRAKLHSHKKIAAKNYPANKFHYLQLIYHHWVSVFFLELILTWLWPVNFMDMLNHIM